MVVVLSASEQMVEIAAVRSYYSLEHVVLRVLVVVVFFVEVFFGDFVSYSVLIVEVHRMDERMIVVVLLRHHLIVVQMAFVQDIDLEIDDVTAH